jgi:3-oxoacyl-[acyl-carrier protein] reductase
MQPGVEMSLAGKTALVSGGSRGIGAATVRLLVQAGARVAFSYQNATQRAEALVEQCGGGERCIALRQELSSPAEGRSLVEQAVSALGSLDILVVNHGIWPPESLGIDAMSDAHWRRTLDVNLDSSFGLVQGAVKRMRKQGRRSDGQPAGRIVLIGSTAGQRGEAFHVDYSVSKFAVIALTRSLCVELAPDDIRVNCVSPGWVSTEMSAPAIGDPARKGEICAAIPVGRPGFPEEIAGPVLFLCTPHSNFMNGSVMSVNGGAVLAG